LPPAIEAVGQVVLDADADDVPVFFHPRDDGNLIATKRNAKEKSKRRSMKITPFFR